MWTSHLPRSWRGDPGWYGTDRDSLSALSTLARGRMGGNAYSQYDCVVSYLYLRINYLGYYNKPNYNLISDTKYGLVFESGVIGEGTSSQIKSVFWLALLRWDLGQGGVQEFCDTAYRWLWGVGETGRCTPDLLMWVGIQSIRDSHGGALVQGIQMEAILSKGGYAI